MNCGGIWAGGRGKSEIVNPIQCCGAVAPPGKQRPTRPAPESIDSHSGADSLIAASPTSFSHQQQQQPCVRPLPGQGGGRPGARPPAAGRASARARPTGGVPVPRAGQRLAGARGPGAAASGGARHGDGAVWRREGERASERSGASEPARRHASECALRRAAVTGCVGEPTPRLCRYGRKAETRTHGPGHGGPLQRGRTS